MSRTLKHSPQSNNSRARLGCELLEDRSVPATINGIAFYDLNNNGSQDTGEGFAQGVGVLLSPTSGSPVSTTTNANGYYEFTGLASGSCSVQYTPPSGYTVGTPSGGSTMVNLANESDTVGIGVGLAANLPVVSVQPISNPTEGGDHGVIRFVRGGDLSAALTVYFSSTASIATSGTDYTPIGTQILIAAGAQYADLDVTALNDNEFEDPETIEVAVPWPQNGEYAVGPSSHASLTINDMPPEVTSSVIWEGGEPEIGQVTLTRGGGDITQPLTAWFEVEGTVDDDGEMLNVVMAATAVFAANETVLIIPIIADPNNGGIANVQMPGASPVPLRADQSQQLNTYRSNLDNPSGSQFGAAVLGLPPFIENLPSPITHTEFWALLSIRNKIQSMDPSLFEEAQEKTKILDAITAKMSLGVEWRTLDPLVSVQVVGGGALAAAITVAPNWVQVEQKANALIADLGSAVFQTREAAERDLKNLVNGYLMRNDLTHTTLLIRLLKQSKAASQDPEVVLRINRVIGSVSYSVIYLPEKLNAIAAVAGAWVLQ